MQGMDDKKSIIDEIMDPGDSPLGWCLAIVAVVVIGLFVLLSR
jgi:hypothetical protein